MNEEIFRTLALEAWAAMPEKFAKHVKNVALLVEDEPSEELREIEGLKEGETLLGHYHGIRARKRVWCRNNASRYHHPLSTSDTR